MRSADASARRHNRIARCSNSRCRAARNSAIIRSMRARRCSASFWLTVIARGYRDAPRVDVLHCTALATGDNTVSAPPAMFTCEHRAVDGPCRVQP